MCTSKIRVFIDYDLTGPQLSYLRTFDRKYIPSTSTALGYNKTITCETNTTRAIVRVNIFFSKSEIFIPTHSQTFFRDYMMGEIVRYLIESIKSFCNVDLANELGFSISFHVEQCTPADSHTWWTGIADRWGLVYTGVRPNGWARFKMPIKFDSAFNLTLR